MKNKFISYDDIGDGKYDIPEKIDKQPGENNPYVSQDLIVLLEIQEARNQMHTITGIRKNKIEMLKQQLNYSYDKNSQRNDYDEYQQRSKNVLENVKRNNEVSVVTEEAKLKVLKDIMQKGLIVDKIRFSYEEAAPMTCLSVVIWDIDEWYDDEDEEPYIYIHPEFVLNAAWHIQQPAEEDDISWEISLDEIQEIIVNNTRYTFLF